MKDTLSALEGSASSEVFAQHLNALHATKRAFIKSEAEEMVRRTLWNKVRAEEEIFKNRD